MSIFFNNSSINDWNFGEDNIIKVYRNGAVVYYKVTNETPTPTGSTCFEIISEPITSYTSTTYDSVYTYYDEKWYMLNNLNQYEEYGVYDIVEDIASATTYEGKLGVVGETEYQYSGGSWSVVGSYVDSSVTYTITNESPSPYVGQELSTTFKIPLADITGSSIQFQIYAEGSGYLDIRVYKTSSSSRYRYSGNGSYTGTVTKDDEYAYLSLPSEAPQSIVINSVQYMNSAPIRLIVGSKSISVEYVEKAVPSSALTYSTVVEMESVGCPDVGIGQYCYTNGQTYRYSSNEEWNLDSNMFIKQFKNDGTVGVLPCGYNNNVLDVGILGNKSGSISSDDPTLEVIIGDCATEIGEKGLYGLGNMTACTIGSGVTSIGNYGFGSCFGLSSITIPSGVTTIQARAFDNCTSLTSITVPTSAIYLHKFSFAGTPWWNTYSADTSHRYSSVVYLNDVAMHPINSSITNVSFKEGTIGIAINAFNDCSGLKYINILDSITDIGSGAFSSCSGLTSVTIGSGVTSIGDNNFSLCSSLTSITIPDNVTSIESGAFRFSGLKSINIPDSVTDIGSGAFSNCSGLTSVTIGSGVTSIGESNFINCYNLTSVTVKATTPPSLGSNAFNATNDCPIYVPSQSVDVYKSASGWSTYASRIQPIT